MRRFNAYRDNGGWTVIELVIVMVMVGLLVSLVAPRIDTTKYRVESAVQGLGVTLLAQERLAITKQHDIILLFDQADNAIRIHEDNNNNALIDLGERVRRVPLGEGIVFGRGGASARPMGPGPITFAKRVGGVPALVFHRDGSASEAAGFYITSVRAASGTVHATDARAIELEAATGRASWYRYNGTTWLRAF
ncbi:MAG TPA: type II secretion system protein [Gemmatimonadales bacterium]